MTKKELYDKADNYKHEINEVKQVNIDKLSDIEKILKVNFINSSYALEAMADRHEDENQVITGLAQAYDFALSEARLDNFLISVDTIKHLHNLIYKQISVQEAGQFRKLQCSLFGTKYMGAAPEELDHLMEHFINQMNSSKRLLHPLEYAAICHKRVIDIHPFLEGTGHIARFLMFMILENEGYGITLIPSNKREEYIHSLMTSHREKNPDFDVFNKFIAECVIESEMSFMGMLGQE
jgi:Fic family protein